MFLDDGLRRALDDPNADMSVALPAESAEKPSYVPLDFDPAWLADGTLFTLLSAVMGWRA
jgi:hypothetical protein